MGVGSLGGGGLARIEYLRKLRTVSTYYLTDLAQTNSVHGMVLAYATDDHIVDTMGGICHHARAAGCAGCDATPREA